MLFHPAKKQVAPFHPPCTQHFTEEETFHVIRGSSLVNIAAEPDAADEILMHLADDWGKMSTDELGKARKPVAKTKNSGESRSHIHVHFP